MQRFTKRLATAIGLKDYEQVNAYCARWELRQSEFLRDAVREKLLREAAPLPPGKVRAPRHERAHATAA